MNIKTLLALLALGTALLLPTEGLAAAKTKQASDPVAVVQGFYDALEDAMKAGARLGFEGRYKKLEPVILKSFDMDLMTRFAVGSRWRTATPEQKKAVLEAFSSFSIATYASRFKKHDGERFEILGQQPAMGDSVMVETRIVPKDEPPVKLNYRMRKDDKGAYRIVDVYLNAAISELATRRADFGAVIKREGLEGLVSSLNEKTTDLKNKGD